MCPVQETTYTEEGIDRVRAYLLRQTVPNVEDVMDRLVIYVKQLLHWQSRLNLIGPATVKTIWGRHILDSLQLLPLLPSEASYYVDLGSGAGFPGVPLAIVFSGQRPLHIDLVEADLRKCAFLTAILPLAPDILTIRQERIEQMTLPRAADVVLSRALAPLNRLFPYAYPHLSTEGICLFLKGRRVDQELTESRSAWSFCLDPIKSVTEPQAFILKISALAPAIAD